MVLLSKYDTMVSTDRFCVKVPNMKDGKMPLEKGILNKEYIGAVGGTSEEMWILNFEDKGVQDKLADFGWSKVSPTLQQTCIIALENSSNCLQRMVAFDNEALRFFAKPAFKWTLEPEIPEDVPLLPTKQKTPKQI